MSRLSTLSLATILLLQTSSISSQTASSLEAEMRRALEHFQANQASPADTIILPPSADSDNSSGGDYPIGVHHLPEALRSAGLPSLHTIGLIDAKVDNDACEQAPLIPRYADAAPASKPEYHSPSLQEMAKLLRAKGFTVTVLSGTEIAQADQVEQKRLALANGSYSLAYADKAGGRRFSTNEERHACLDYRDMVAYGDDTAWKRKHIALAHILDALHQDAVLAIEELRANSKGFEVSTGMGSTHPAKSEAEVVATLILKDGSIPWRGTARAEGALSPALEKDAETKLNTFMTATFGEPDPKHPDEKKLANETDEKSFSAIMSGDLAEAPIGSTLGPSAAATMLAAAQRLYTQIGF